MKVKICMGSTCTMMGANSILDSMENIKEEFSKAEYDTENLEIELSKCMNYCKENENMVSPVVIIDGETVLRASAHEISEIVLDKIKR